MSGTHTAICRRIRRAVLLFLLLSLSLLFFSLYHDYQQEARELTGEGEKQARIMAEHAARTLGEADRALDLILHEIKNNGGVLTDERELFLHFQTLSRSMPQAVSMYYVDRRGVLSASSLAYPITLISLADREYFIRHRDDPGDSSYISRTYYNRISNQWRFSISRRLKDADGRFAGLIAVSIEPAYFEKLYATLVGSRSHHLALVRNDGFLVVASPADERALSTTLSGSRLFSQALQQAPWGAYRETGDPFVNADCLVAYSKLPGDYPLVARICYNWEELIAPWKRDTLVKVLIAAIFAGVVLVLMFQLERWIADLKKSAAQVSLLSRIIDQSPVSVVVTDREGSIGYVNPTFTRLTGYTSEEALGQNPRILKTDQTDPELFRQMWEHLQSGREWSGELCNRRKDGSVYWELAHLFPVVAEDGSIAHFAAVKEDITGRKQAESELQKAHGAALAASQAKSEFLANMSHEIRTPLNGVIGMGQLLKNTPLMPEQKEYAEAIVQSGNSLLAIINDLLDLSKIEAKRVELEQRDFSLAACLEEVVRNNAARAEAKGLTIGVERSADLPDGISGDPLRLKQVLNNLVGNAVKFTESGRVTISASQPAAGRLDLAVSDTGIGISPDALGKIFDPFIQADSSITRRFGGTGLGLTICQRLAVLMGGGLAVESRPGGGSTFRLSLPLVPASGPVPLSHTVSMDDVWDGPGLDLLLVEDSDINRTLASRILEKIGHRVQVAGDGRQALEKLAHGQYDLVLMDINMPVLGGDEALQELRRGELQTGRHQPVIALTAYALKDEQERFLAMGFDGCATKPLEYEKLVLEMKRVLGRVVAAGGSGTDQEV